MQTDSVRAMAEQSEPKFETIKINGLELRFLRGGFVAYLHSRAAHAAQGEAEEQSAIKESAPPEESRERPIPAEEKKPLEEAVEPAPREENTPPVEEAQEKAPSEEEVQENRLEQLFARTDKVQYLLCKKCGTVIHVHPPGRIAKCCKVEMVPLVEMQPQEEESAEVEEETRPEAVLETPTVKEPEPAEAKDVSEMLEEPAAEAEPAPAEESPTPVEPEPEPDVTTQRESVLQAIMDQTLPAEPEQAPSPTADQDDLTDNIDAFDVLKRLRN
jgi:hypothetical protein